MISAVLATGIGFETIGFLTGMFIHHINKLIPEVHEEAFSAGWDKGFSRGKEFAKLRSNK